MIKCNRLYFFWYYWLSVTSISFLNTDCLFSLTELSYNLYRKIQVGANLTQILLRYKLKEDIELDEIIIINKIKNNNPRVEPTFSCIFWSWATSRINILHFFWRSIMFKSILLLWIIDFVKSIFSWYYWTDYLMN